MHPDGSDVARAGGLRIAVTPLHLLQLCFSPRRVRARHPDHDQGQHQQRRGLYLHSPPLIHHLGRHFLGPFGARLFCRPTRLVSIKKNARAGVLWKFGNLVLKCLSQNIDFYFWRSILFWSLVNLSREKMGTCVRLRRYQPLPKMFGIGNRGGAGKRAQEGNEGKEEANKGSRSRGARSRSSSSSHGRPTDRPRP